VAAAGETALALAAGAGQLGTVELLLAAGADPGLASPGSAAPLHRAASSGLRVQDAYLGVRVTKQEGGRVESGVMWRDWSA
jgi:ankyrin repeat protein